MIAKSPHPAPPVLISKIYSSFDINNLVLKIPEAGEATLYNTTRGLHHEIRAKRGKKFGSQIGSPDRQGGVSRFNAPQPPVAALPPLVAAPPR